MEIRELTVFATFWGWSCHLGFGVFVYFWELLSGIIIALAWSLQQFHLLAFTQAYIIIFPILFILPFKFQLFERKREWDLYIS